MDSLCCRKKQRVQKLKAKTKSSKVVISKVGKDFKEPKPCSSLARGFVLLNKSVLATEDYEALLN